MTEDFKCNVLIMGKTGTGKSTLLNYLCGTDLAKTGTGKPVTGEGIYEFPAIINGQEVRIFDSWGIEAGKVDRWKKLIDESLHEHGVQKSMEDWFHSVIYCVQAGGGRVEDIDAEIIKKFLSEGYLLTVVLTKADQVDEEAEDAMRSVILKELQKELPVSDGKKGTLNVIATCAEKKKTRSGETQPFGKEEVQRAILDGWKRTVLERMPKHVVERLKQYVDEWEETEMCYLTNTSISGVAERNAEIYKEIESDATQFGRHDLEEKYKDILQDVVESCQKADTSIKKTFRIEFTPDAFSKETEDDNLAWWEWIIAIPATPIAFAIVKVKEWIHNKSASHIAEEKTHIEEYIETIANKFRSQCESMEPKIKKELQKII